MTDTLRAIYQDKCNKNDNDFANESGSSYVLNTAHLFKTQWLKLKNFSSAHSTRSPPLTGPSASKALVIDGESLALALRSSSSRKLLLSVCKEFNTVICCRATPLQKVCIVNVVIS